MFFPQDEFVSLLKLPSTSSPDGAPHAPISLLASHVSAFLSQLESTSPEGTLPARSGANGATAWRARAEGLLQRSGELRRQLLQLKRDVSAWTAAAVSARPQEAELERCVKEVDDKLLKMKAATASLATATSKSHSAPAYLEADVTSLAAAVRAAHATSLLHRAFGGSSLPRHRACIMGALRLVRDHHVHAVARLLEGAFDVRVEAGDAQQQLKFEGLAAGMFEKQEIVNCVQVVVAVIAAVVVVVAVAVILFMPKHPRIPHLSAGAFVRRRRACLPHARGCRRDAAAVMADARCGARCCLCAILRLARDVECAFRLRACMEQALAAV